MTENEIKERAKIVPYKRGQKYSNRAVDKVLRTLYEKFHDFEIGIEGCLIDDEPSVLITGYEYETQPIFRLYWKTESSEIQTFVYERFEEIGKLMHEVSECYWNLNFHIDGVLITEDNEYEWKHE